MQKFLYLKKKKKNKKESAVRLCITNIYGSSKTQYIIYGKQ